MGLNPRKMVLWTVLLLLTSVAASREEFLQKVCYNALETGDPLCLHGGSLYAKNRSDYLNCASCNCPAEWRGVDCGLCTSKEVCPERDGKAPIECTHDQVSMTDREHVVGKQLSCYCGGPDDTTQYICKQQPGTNWQITLLPSGEAGSFNMSVLERAGIPSQDYWPTCYGHPPDACPTSERYRYSAAQVWEGHLTDCIWEKGDCVLPLKGSDCILYKCKHVKIECPPAYVEKCPEWSPFECGKPLGEDMPYWMHHCNPLALPIEGLPLTVGCKEKKENGLFQCYLSQEGSFFSSLGMQCETGTCIYEDSATFHHGHTRPDEDLWDWLDENQAELVIALMWLCLIVVSLIALILIRRDKKRSLKRAEEWANDQQNSTGLYMLMRQNMGFLEDVVVTRALVLHFEDIEYYVKLRGGRIKHILRSVHGLAAPHQVSHQVA